MAEVIPITSHPRWRAPQPHSYCTECGGVVGTRQRVWAGTTVATGERVLFCASECFVKWNAGGQS